MLIPTPSGLAPPLVTGTFGSADFIHSVLGEASEYVVHMHTIVFVAQLPCITFSHLSQASIVDLTVHMEEVRAFITP